MTYPVRGSQRGFTLVEAVIVAVVIAVVLAVTIPWMSEKHHERERQRLQALAYSRPWEVFELRAKPTKESFAEDEKIVIQCEFVNLTDYELTTPKTNLGWPALALEESYREAQMVEVRDASEQTQGGGGRSTTVQVRAAGRSTLPDFDDLSQKLSGLTMGPRESLSFEARYDAVCAGPAEVRLVFCSAVYSSKRRGAFIRPGGRSLASAPFHVYIEAGEDSELPSFEQQRLQILAETTPWEFFEIHARPAKAIFSEKEAIVIECDVKNVTSYPLYIPNSMSGYLGLVLADDPIFGGYVGIPVSIPESPVAPGASERIEFRNDLDGTVYNRMVGTAEVVVVYWKNYQAELSLSEIPNILLFETSDKLPFRSNTFELTVEAAVDSTSATFDDLKAEMSRARMRSTNVQE